MSFTADKQTLDDLNILGKYKSDSIFSLFNQMQTAGGEKLLDSMFRNALNDPYEINKRSRVFRYFQEQVLAFPFDKEAFALMENYLHEAGDGNMLISAINTQRKQLLNLVLKDERYAMLLSGIKATVTILCSFKCFLGTFDEQNVDYPYLEKIQQARSILTDKRLVSIIEEGLQKQLSFFKVAKLEHLLRHLLHAELRNLMEIIYHLDVYIAVGGVAASKNFTYAKALPKNANELSADELYHPRLKNAATNTISLYQDNNVLFLTGANMAGKSTFMKAFGIAVYLAHMGFPVAARDMRFSVKDGIYSSINVPDNLNMGLSHFYAEVLRVKKVAEEVSESKDLIVIFDELFKGTNVKDAYDATLAVTEAFAENRNCFFMISTHIIEVGEELRERCNNFCFAYLPTIMEGVIPRYTYKLKEGITSDRQGMIIIENEGILDIIRSGKV
jgi:DNA mismatch repair protein MutS